MHHIIESQQFDRELLEKLFDLADKLENDSTRYLEGRVMASLFYEPSTRTRFSFESAMLRLGGSVLATENAKEFSSSAKGETLEDTIRVINHYADIIVMRHFEKGAAAKAAAVSKVPIINAGDGAGQHPTQALLDAYTIKREKKKIDGLKIAMVGDLKNGRTVRSLSYLLGKFERIEIVFASPPELAIGEDILEYLDKHNIKYIQLNNLLDAIPEADIVYQTRIQKERFEDPKDVEKFKGLFRITPDSVKKMKPGAIIMHPLPRVDEISIEVDLLPQAIYFKQAYYGLLARKALLYWSLKNGNGTPSIKYKL